MSNNTDNADVWDEVEALLDELEARIKLARERARRARQRHEDDKDTEDQVGRK